MKRFLTVAGMVALVASGVSIPSHSANANSVKMYSDGSKYSISNQHSSTKKTSALKSTSGSTQARRKKIDLTGCDSPEHVLDCIDSVSSD